MDEDRCPHCNSDLRAGEIPVAYLREGMYGEWKEGDPPRYFSRKIMVEIRGVYDGGLFFRCPDCGGTWHRWPEGSSLRKDAERYM